MKHRMFFALQYHFLVVHITALDVQQSALRQTGGVARVSQQLHLRQASVENTSVLDLLSEGQNGIAPWWTWPGLRDEVEIELNIDHDGPVMVNKAALAILNGFCLGVFGIDRCYARQFTLGLLKCFTMGGFGIWFLVDFIVIGANCLTRSPRLTSLGFSFAFDIGDQNLAFMITLIFILCHCFFGKCLPILRLK